MGATCDPTHSAQSSRKYGPEFQFPLRFSLRQ